jgi:hypothetical protein
MLENQKFPPLLFVEYMKKKFEKKVDSEYLRDKFFFPIL